MILLLTEDVPLHRVTEINPYFPTVLVIFYLIWCMMGQNTGAGREFCSVLSHPSFCVVRVKRAPYKSNGKRSRSRPPGARSSPVTWGGGSWRGGTFVQNVGEASGRTQIKSIKGRFVFNGHIPESEGLRNEK